MFLNKSRVWLLTAEHRHIPKTNVGGEGKRSLLSCCIILGNKSFTGSKLLSSTKHRRKLFFKKDFTYLFLEREGGREKERETSMCDCVSRTPYWGPGPRSKHVPWLEIEPGTIWFTGWRSIHWAIPVRAKFFFNVVNVVFSFLAVIQYIKKLGWVLGGKDKGVEKYKLAVTGI